MIFFCKYFRGKNLKFISLWNRKKATSEMLSVAVKNPFCRKAECEKKDWDMPITQELTENQQKQVLWSNQFKIWNLWFKLCPVYMKVWRVMCGLQNVIFCISVSGQSLLRYSNLIPVSIVISTSTDNNVIAVLYKLQLPIPLSTVFITLFKLQSFIY